MSVHYGPWGEDEAAKQEAVLLFKSEKQATLAWLANRPDVYVTTIERFGSDTWVIMYLRNGQEYRMTVKAGGPVGGDQSS